MLIHQDRRIDQKKREENRPKNIIGRLSGPVMDDGTTAERWVHPDLESRNATPKVSPGPPSMVLEVLRSRY